jgi:diacylglycerol kinase family enzyme
VTLDGEEIFNGPGLAFVGNVSRYATGLQILGDADYGDGLLDVCIYKCAHRPHLVKHSLMTILKRHAKCRDVIYRQGRTVTVTSTYSQTKTEVDGDPGPRLPAEIHIIPQAISVLVPKEAKPAGIRTRILRAIG